MTSVQNRLRRSSGSKVVLLLAVLLIAACTSKKDLKDSTSSDAGVRVYNPKTGEYELVEDPKELIDTVQWVEKTDVPDPIGPVDETPKGFKDIYNITYLMPFDTDGGSFGNNIDARTRRFLNYYGGVTLALADLEAQGINLNVNVVDTKESPEVVRAKMKEYADSDVFIGPYDRDALDQAATFAKEEDVIVVSPWTPTIIPTTKSENFLQVVPGLQTHADAAVRFATRRYPGARYVLVATPETKGQSRMDIYNEAYRATTSGQEDMEMLVVDEVALSPDSNALTAIYDTGLTHVFFMPYYLRSEESFVNSFMRKVHAEHGFTEVVIIGLPQWLSYSSIDPDYLENLNTHVTAFQFADNSDTAVREFNRRYYNRFGGVPETAAWRGYDLTMYIGKKLYEYGTGFTQKIMDDFDADLRFRPVRLPGSSSEPPRAHYLENKGVAILIFEDQQFRRLE